MSSNEKDRESPSYHNHNPVIRPFQSKIIRENECPSLDSKQSCYNKLTKASFPSLFRVLAFGFQHKIFFSFLLESCRKGFIDDDENEAHIANFHAEVKEDEDVVIERQPLRNGDHLLDDKKIQLGVNKSPTRSNHQSRTILCFSRDPIEDDQVDLFPKLWCNICDKSDPEDNQNTPCSTICWRVGFLATCLPLCYCCYISRTLRRRRRKTTLMKYFDSQNPDTFILQNVSKPKHFGISSQTNENLHLIPVNVVILQSPSSLYIQSNWYNTDSLDGHNNPSSNSPTTSPVILRKKAVFAQPHIQGAYSTKLTSVQELNEDSIFDDSHENSRKSFNQPARNGKKVSVVRKWSRLGSTVARISTSFRRSKNAEMKNDPEELFLSPLKSQEFGSHQSLFKNHCSLRSSSLSGTSVYYSADEESVLDFRDAEIKKKEQSVHVKAIGQRHEILQELGYQISFSFFDEDSVTKWKGKDLNQADEVPNFDIIVVAVKQGNLGEVNTILDTSSGLMGHFSVFWRGFYPLLLIELQNHDQSFEEVQEFQSQLKKLCKYFGVVHHIKLFEDNNDAQLTWIDECLARLFIHSRVYQCPRLFGNHVSELNKCPGGCGLSKRRTRVKLSRPRNRKMKFKSVYKKSRASIYGYPVLK